MKDLDLLKKYDSVFKNIKYLREDYPGFDFWFWNKVVPEVESGSGEREIIAVNNVSELIGVSILKKTNEESKICTLVVFPQFEKRGYGVKLFDKSFEFLEDRKPLLSVSEKNHHKYKRIFDFYGFELTSVKNGIYIPNKMEFFYNEK